MDYEPPLRRCRSELVKHAHMKPVDPPSAREVQLEKDRRPPPLYITFFLIFLFHLSLFLFMICVLLAGLFKLLAVLIGFPFFWCLDDE